MTRQEARKETKGEDNAEGEDNETRHKLQMPHRLLHPFPPLLHSRWKTNDAIFRLSSAVRRISVKEVEDDA